MKPSFNFRKIFITILLLFTILGLGGFSLWYYLRLGDTYYPVYHWGVIQNKFFHLLGLELPAPKFDMYMEFLSGDEKENIFKLVDNTVEKSVITVKTGEEITYRLFLVNHSRSAVIIYHWTDAFDIDIFDEDSFSQLPLTIYNEKGEPIFQYPYSQIHRGSLDSILVPDLFGLRQHHWKRKEKPLDSIYVLKFDKPGRYSLVVHASFHLYDRLDFFPSFPTKQEEFNINGVIHIEVLTKEN